MPGKPMMNTKNFYRVLSDADRAVLLAAGGGNITTGFHEVLRVYAEMHNLGFKRDTSVYDFVYGEDMTEDLETILDRSGEP